jgi:hypothetical protein
VYVVVVVAFLPFLSPPFVVPCVLSPHHFDSFLKGLGKERRWQDKKAQISLRFLRVGYIRRFLVV